eukprot:g2483.t1
MYYPGEEPHATAVTARSNHCHDGRFGGGSIYCHHWALDILVAVKDQNEEKMREALSFVSEGADVNMKITGGERGTPYRFAHNGIYDASSPHQNYIFEHIRTGDSLLHLALRNALPQAALLLVELGADTIAENNLKPPQSIGALWEKKWAEYEALETQMNKFGIGSMSFEERGFIREVKDYYPKLNEVLAGSVVDYKKKKVERIKAFMCELFRVHHPTKLAEADTIMHQYQDREDELMEVLMNKYEVDEFGNHLHGEPEREESDGEEEEERHGFSR